MAQKQRSARWPGYLALTAAGALAIVLATLPAALDASGAQPDPLRIQIPKKPGAVARVKTTGYCECQHCCSWRRSWFGLGPPVISKGPNRGDKKVVGMTASGSWARPGVIAADTRIFPMGTIFYIPDYGWGRVEDTGGDIKGYHIDLYFDGHQIAREWGVRIKEVKFWRPPGTKPAKQKILKTALSNGPVDTSGGGRYQ